MPFRLFAMRFTAAAMQWILAILYAVAVVLSWSATTAWNRFGQIGLALIFTFWAWSGLRKFWEGWAKVPAPPRPPVEFSRGFLVPGQLGPRAWPTGESMGGVPIFRDPDFEGPSDRPVLVGYFVQKDEGS